MKMVQKGLFRVCFQPITMMNCCTTCIFWEIGSYNTQQSRHNEHTHFCRTYVAKSAIWFFENEGGGVKGRLEFFQKSSVLVGPSVPKGGRESVHSFVTFSCGWTLSSEKLTFQPVWRCCLQRCASQSPVQKPIVCSKQLSFLLMISYKGRYAKAKMPL